MRIVTETLTKVVIESSLKELTELGFDNVWNQIRDKYPSEEYKVFSIEKKNDDKNIYYIELIPYSLES